MANITNNLILRKNIDDWSLFLYDSLDSTNEEIKRLYSVCGTKKLIIVSNKQSQGKGQYKRHWLSPYKSGLYVSWLFLDNFNNSSVLSIVAGLLCIKSLREYSSCNVLLKWPNDLVFNNKKLGGILIEKFEDFKIIGLGLNLIANNEFPPNAVCLNQIVPELENDFDSLRNNLLEKLTNVLENGLISRSVTKNEQILNEACNYLSTPIGSLVRFVKDDTVYAGKVLGLGDGGELIVEIENNKKVFLRTNEKLSLYESLRS